MPLIITRAQRDAIYEVVVTHLSGIGDVWLSVDRRDFATAKRLGRKFAQDLRLLEDLGWAETIDRETVALTAPPDELTRTLARLRNDASGALGTYVSRPKDDEELAQRDLAASEALGEVLSQLARPADVMGQDATKDQAPVPDLIVAGHGLEVAVEVYCPRQWEALGELEEFAVALKNLDVAYDYDYEVRVGQLERFDEQGLIQLHPGSLAERLKPEVRRDLLSDLLEELALTLVDAPPSVRVERRREDLNLGVSIALTSIERSRGRFPSRTGGLSGPSITGHDPAGMFDRLVDKRVRAKAARGQAVGHAPLSLLLVDLSRSELTDELGHSYYREKFAETLRRRLGRGLKGYDMIAFCESRGWRQELRLHYMVREEHVVEEVPALLFGDSDREPCESARQAGSVAADAPAVG